MISLLLSTVISCLVTRDSYDLTATAYAEKTAALYEEREMGEFLSHLSPNSALLDLGCGAGRDAKIFSEMD